MTSRKILIPYNFTPNDQKALDFAMELFHNQPDVDITLFTAYTPAPEVDVRNNPIMEKMTSNLNYLRQKVHEQENQIKLAVRKLVDKGFSQDRVHYLFQPREGDVASHIISIVKKQRFNMVIINRSPRRISRFFTGSVFEKVVTNLSDVTVCIVT